MYSMMSILVTFCIMDNQILENQLQFHVLHSQHKFIQSNTTQDNTIFSNMINVFLISMFGVLSQHLIRYLSRCTNVLTNIHLETKSLKALFKCKKVNKIILNAKEIKYANSNQSAWSFSDVSKALLWYCNRHLDDMNICQLVETNDDVVQDRWYHEDLEKEQNMKTYVAPTFRIDQRSRFLLKKDIYIQFCFSNAEDESMNDGKRQCISYKVYRIELTTTKPVSCIYDTIEQIQKEYIHDINTNTLKGQYVFTYKGENKFHQEPFYCNKSWNTLFLEYKDRLRLNIQQMKNFDDPDHINKLAGLPDQLAIMAHGPPGTGKNSIFKALMKEEFHDRHLVIIPATSIKSPQEIVEIMRSQYINNIFCPCNKRVYQFDEIEKSFPELTQMPMTKLQEVAHEEYKKLKGPKPPSFEDFLQSMKQKDEQKRNLSRQVWCTLLDGAQERKGLVIFITLNNYDILDDIFKRPGRIHLRIPTKLATKEIAKSIIQHIFSYDFRDEATNRKIDMIEDNKHSQSKIITKCCNEILDFKDMKNNLEYINRAVDSLSM